MSFISISRIIPIIRIGSHDFRHIEWTHDQGMAKGRFGEFNAIDGTISIDWSLPHKALNTLLHEITHAILWEFNVHVDDQLEEDVCNAIASGFLVVLRDNPQILKLVDDWSTRTRRSRPK